MRSLIFCLALALAPGAALAKASFSLDLERADFVTQKVAIEKAITTSDELREITAEEREFVRARLAEIEAELAPAGSLQALDEAARKSVLADQQAINERLREVAEASRVVCRNEHVVGSHRAKKVCRTVAASRRDARETQDSLNVRRLPNTSCPTCGN